MMKKIIYILLCIIALSCLLSCTNKQPVADAPVYNITFTDNSQLIVGDQNSTESHAETKTEQVAKPVASIEDKEVVSRAWILCLILAVVACGTGVLAWKKGWIKL